MKKRSREAHPRKQTLVATLSQSSAPSLIKHLASCNATVRFQSLGLLQTWLMTTAPTASTMVSDADMKKLWKGLFYCIWHCDKAPAQAELINRLSSLLVSLTPALSVHYFSTFVLTLRREWTGIDHLRLDKFYLLIRRFIKSMFLLFRKHNWDLNFVAKFMDILEFNAFLAKDKLLGNGVNYQVVSVYLDELKGCFVPMRKEVVNLLFKPFFGVMCRCLDKVLVGKVKALVFEELLKIGRTLLIRKRDQVEIKEKEDGYDDVAFGLIAMKMGFSGRFYEVGSSQDCIQGNRKVVFGLHEEILKLEKVLESSRIDILIPDVDEVDNDDEVVPDLIPIENSEKEGAASEQIAESADRIIIVANGNKEEIDLMLEDEENARRTKKARKGSEVSNKKAKKKKKKAKNDQVEASDVSVNALADGNVATDKGACSKLEPEPDGNDGNVLNANVIANLSMQFEKVASEVGSDNDDDGSSFGDNSSVIDNKSPKKRKKLRRTVIEDPSKTELIDTGNVGVCAGKSMDKSAKKVRFAMKNNLVWKPHSPLPPQSLRIPPSLTPRGSALKKGVPPGPIRELPPPKKKLKQKKKGRKILKSISPAMKRLHKL